jgi:hypothetical protein
MLRMEVSESIPRQEESNAFRRGAVIAERAARCFTGGP